MGQAWRGRLRREAGRGTEAELQTRWAAGTEHHAVLLAVPMPCAVFLHHRSFIYF